MLPHTSPIVFCKGSTILGLHQLARGLITAAIDHVILVGYGMKSPIEDFADLFSIATTVPRLSNRYDLGRYVPGDALYSVIHHCCRFM